MDTGIKLIRDDLCDNRHTWSSKVIADRLKAVQNKLDTNTADLKEELVQLTNIVAKNKHDDTGVVTELKAQLAAINTEITSLENNLNETRTALENSLNETRTALENSLNETRTALENSLTETQTNFENSLLEAKNNLENSLTETKAELEDSIAETQTSIENHTHTNLEFTGSTKLGVALNWIESDLQDMQCGLYYNQEDSKLYIVVNDNGIIKRGDVQLSSNP